MKLLLLLTNNNASKSMKRSMRSVNVMLQLRLKRSNSNWKKEITVYVSSYIDIIESKMSFTLNKIKKRNERNVSRHSLSSNNFGLSTKGVCYR